MYSLRGNGVLRLKRLTSKLANFALGVKRMLLIRGLSNSRDPVGVPTSCG